MLLTGIWHGGLSDEAVEDMANANLYVLRFLGLSPGVYRIGQVSKAYMWNEFQLLPAPSFFTVSPKAKSEIYF